MNLEEMIQTECTDGRYDAWSDYRNDLTNYIIEGIGHYYRKQKINQMGARRLSTAIDTEALLGELEEKPVVAIFGAGGGNDIDLPRLSKYFQLVLIDHNMEQLRKTSEKFGLSKKQCTCMDLQFWDITLADYKAIEAMLRAGRTDEEIIHKIDEIIMRMPTWAYSKMQRFDFSICVGLASQLNARLGMLLSIYGRGTNFAKYLCELNDIAVNKLADVVYSMTNNAILYGYEVMAIRPCETLLADLLTYEPEEWEQKSNWPPHSLTTDVSGNDNLSEWITENLQENKIIANSYETLVWPFAEWKHYIMLLCFFEKDRQLSRQ